MASTLRNRLFVGLSLAAVILAAVAAAVSLGARRFAQSSAWVEHTHRVLEAIETTYSDTKEAEAAQRGFLLTGRIQFEQIFFTAMPRARASAAEVVRLVHDNPDQAPRSAKLGDLVDKRLQAAAETADLYRQGGLEAVRDVLAKGRGAELMQQIEAIRTEMMEVERGLLVERAARSDADAFWLQLYTDAGLALSLGILAFIAWRMLREMAWRERAEARTTEANESLHASVAQLRARGEQTREMSRYAGMLQSCRSVDEALEIASDTLLRLMPELGGALYLVRASQDLAERMAVWGEQPASSAALLPPQDCWALRRGQSYEVDDVHHATKCAHVELPPLGSPASYICIPLVAHGQTMGFLYLSGGGDAVAGRRDVAVAAAEQLSLALSNLRLQESLRVQSIRDPLTGLYNRRYLEESLERELARCSRRNLPLTVIMIDLDHFKRFNDTHGHDGGDALLTQAGKLLQSLCRNEDIACRYGGEEFTLILPEMGREPALQRAEEVRAAIEALQVQHLRQMLTPVTASMGLATFPLSATHGADLVRVADGALYQAKQDGRNRVVVA